jgi:hypothetical protein
MMLLLNFRKAADFCRCWRRCQAYTKQDAYQEPIHLHWTLFQLTNNGCISKIQHMPDSLVRMYHRVRTPYGLARLNTKTTDPRGHPD